MKKFEHGGNIYDMPRDVLDFSANINPLGLSEKVRSEIESQIDNLIHYPDPQMKQLKESISNRYNLPIEKISCYNGATEFFYTFFNTIRPARILIPVPSFSEYERAGQFSTIEYFYLKPANSFKIPAQLLKTKLNQLEKATLIFANPNNPTGNLLEPDELAKILEASKSKAEWIIIDESFLDFVRDSEKYTARNFLNEYDNLIVVTSLTKFFAMPGLRIGFAASNEKLREQLENSKDVWNVNSLAQRAAVVALNDEEYRLESLNLIEDEKEFVEMRLKTVAGIERVFKPSANFILFRLEKSASTLLENLRSKNILLRNCENFEGLDEKYVRMAIRTHDENLRVLEAIENFLEDEDIESVENFWNDKFKEQIR